MKRPDTITVRAQFRDAEREKIDVAIVHPGADHDFYSVDRVEWSDAERGYLSEVGTTRVFNLPPGTPTLRIGSSPAFLLIGQNVIDKHRADGDIA